MHQPTVDQAIAEFQEIVNEALGDVGPATGDRTPQTADEEEESRFRMAELLLRLACPDAGACTEPQCRRNALCRHVERVKAKRAAGSGAHPRRTPGAEAVRYAIRVYMASGR